MKNPYHYSTDLTQSILNDLDNKLTKGGDSDGAKITVGTNDANTFAIETSGLERVTVLSNGNTGILNPNPGKPLAVTGSATVSGLLSVGPVDNNSAYVSITTPALSTAAMRITDSANYTLYCGAVGSGVGYFGGFTGTSLALAANNSEAMRLVSSTLHAGIGTTLPLTRVHVAIDDATNASVTRTGTFQHTTTGTPTAGIGTGIQFIVECASANRTGAAIDAITTDVTNGSEDFDFVFYTMLGNSLSEKFRISSLGELLPKDIHTNGGTGNASNQSISSGVYTPTITNVTNIATSECLTAKWLRVGNVVTVSGRINIDPTLGSTASEIGISLPIASNFSIYADCAGSATCHEVASLCAGIRADTANDRAAIVWVHTADTSAREWAFTFQYEVI